MIRRFIPAFIAALAASYASASFYQYDDGSSNSSISRNIAPNNIVYLTQYTAASGGLNLTSIDLVWGSRGNPNMQNGMPAQVLLLSDPNQDGNPNDSTVLQALSVSTVNVGSDTFNNYPIVPTALNIGQKFFLGAYLPNIPIGMAWASMDANAIGRSAQNWFNSNTSPGAGGPYFQLTIFGLQDETFMVRGNTSPVPEPSSIVAYTLALLFVLRRRSQRP